MEEGNSNKNPLLEMNYTAVYAVPYNGAHNRDSYNAVNDMDYHSGKKNTQNIVEPSHVQLRYPSQSIAEYESSIIQRNLLNSHFDGKKIVNDERRGCIASRYEADHVSREIRTAIHSCVTEDRLESEYLDCGNIPVTKSLPSQSAPTPEYSLSSPNGYKMSEYKSNYEVGAYSIGATQSEYKINEYKSVYEKWLQEDKILLLLKEKEFLLDFVHKILVMAYDHFFRAF